MLQSRNCYLGWHQGPPPSHLGGKKVPSPISFPPSRLSRASRGTEGRSRRHWPEAQREPWPTIGLAVTSPSGIPSPDLGLSTAGPGWQAPHPYSPVSNVVRPRGRASEDRASVPSSKWICGVCTMGLCGPSSAKRQARPRQASRQGGGGLRPQGGDKPTTPAPIGRARAGRVLGQREGRACCTIALCPGSVSPQWKGGGHIPRQPPRGPGSSPGRPQWLRAGMALLLGGTDERWLPPSLAQRPSCLPRASAEVQGPPPSPMGERCQSRAGGKGVGSHAFWEATHN